MVAFLTAWGIVSIIAVGLLYVPAFRAHLGNLDDGSIVGRVYVATILPVVVTLGVGSYLFGETKEDRQESIVMLKEAWGIVIGKPLGD